MIRAPRTLALLRLALVSSLAVVFLSGRASNPTVATSPALARGPATFAPGTLPLGGEARAQLGAVADRRRTSATLAAHRPGPATFEDAPEQTLLTGRVLDRKGEPAQGAEVVLRGAGLNESRTRSRADGTFELALPTEPLGPGPDLFATHPQEGRGCKDLGEHLLLERLDVGDLHILPMIDGRIVCPAGDPVGGAELVLVTESGRKQRGESLADGTFEFELPTDPLGPGPDLHVTHHRAGRGEADLGEHLLAESLDLGDVVLEPMSVLAGVVVDGSGPVAGLELTASVVDEPVERPNDPLTYWHETTTDAGWRFEFRNLQATRYELASSSSEVFGPFEPDREDLVLKLVDGAAFEVRIFGPGGELLREPHPELSRLEAAPDGGWRTPDTFTFESSMTQAEDGTWLLAFRRPGPRTIMAETVGEAPSDWLRAEAFLDVRAGQRGSLDLHLAPVPAISLASVTVLDPEGRAVPHRTRTRFPGTGTRRRSPRPIQGDHLVYVPVLAQLQPSAPSLALPVHLELHGPAPDTVTSPGFGGRVRVHIESPQTRSYWGLFELDGEDVRLEQQAAEPHLEGSRPTPTFLSHPALPAGQYILRRRFFNSPPIEVPVVLRAGQVTEVTLKLD